jgi:hypothetical protein
VGRCHEVGDAGGEVGVDEVALAVPEPGEIEASVAMPCCASVSVIRTMDRMFFEQVKQWAYRAYPMGSPVTG